MTAYLQNCQFSWYSHSHIFPSYTTSGFFNVTNEDGRSNSMLLPTVGHKRYYGFHICHHFLGSHILGKAIYHVPRRWGTEDSNHVNHRSKTEMDHPALVKLSVECSNEGYYLQLISDLGNRLSFSWWQP